MTDIILDEVSDVPARMFEPTTTPRPWVAKRIPPTRHPVQMRTAFICAADGTVISPRVEEIADAQMIVRAVNSFDAMRDALLAAAGLAWEVGSETEDGVHALLDDSRGDLWRQIMAALTLADGGATP